MTSKKALHWLLLSTALGTAGFASAALAQAPQASASQPAGAGGAGDGLLSEVTITATRQVDTVSKVPLSITAVTQKALDQQGITQVTDLTRIVPDLQISTVGGSVGQFSIRGISATAGAAVTGVYLDDTPFTKRNQNGVANLNGSPAPPLFDLERVEVLRGPQGTLYGGSSEGGTIRFITPTPSLTRSSGYARTQISQTQYGGTSYEGGVAVGGPIVQDKLGFRASVFHRYTAGYIDAVNPYTAQVFCKDCNSGTQDVLRAALLWRPTDDLSILTSIYAAKEQQKDTGGSETISAPSAQSVLASGILPAALLVQGWGGLQNRCTAFKPISSTVSAATSRASVTTAVPCTTPGVTFVYPANPWPGYNLSKFQSIRGGPDDTSPFRDYNESASVTADYDLHFATVKAIVSYLQDQEKQVTHDTSIITPLFDGYPGYLPGAPNWNTGGNFRPNNKRWGATQEIRIASPADSRPLTWIVGFFHENIRSHGFYQNVEDIITPTRLITGQSEVDRYGAPLINGVYAQRDQTLKDTETAFFGQVNLYVTDKLKLTGGVRRSNVGFSYNQIFFGPINNNNDPAAIAGGITSGSTHETPVSPMAGVQYQITPNDQVYFTYAKGYRAGGINSPLSEGQCGAALANVGLTVGQIPQSFGSDSLVSYEVGSKVRFFNNRLAVNVAGYIINWTNLQLNIGVNGCGQQWVQNVGGAQSKGVDLEAQFRVFEGFNVTLNANKNDAKYTQSAVGPTPLNGGAPPVFAQAGQSFNNQPYRVNLQAQYSWRLMSKWEAFVRADYTYTPQYTTSVFGLASYSPDSNHRLKTELVNARAGVTVDNLDLSLFVNNVTNSTDGTPGGGRSQCQASSGPSCTVFGNYSPMSSLSTFRPREVGLQASYHF